MPLVGAAGVSSRQVDVTMNADNLIEELNVVCKYFKTQRSLLTWGKCR